ncbi:hypothetical protein BDW22DRAFT_858233 [Trametopsis cervina]|nr:hypothetical protein BDW22DRAFT_858233 [Trametopsis cervina]
MRRPNLKMELRGLHYCAQCSGCAVRYCTTSSPLEGGSERRCMERVQALRASMICGTQIRFNTAPIVSARFPPMANRIMIHELPKKPCKPAKPAKPGAPISNPMRWPSLALAPMQYPEKTVRFYYTSYTHTHAGYNSSSTSSRNQKETRGARRRGRRHIS